MQAMQSDQAYQASQINQINQIDIPEITLHEGTTTIGRANNNIMVISNRGVSYYHAIIITLHKIAYIHDLGSLSGLYVNDKPVQYKILHPGDQVNMGDFSFKVAEIL